MDVPEETEVDLKKDEEDEDGGKNDIPELEAVLVLDSEFFGGHKVKSVTFFPLFMGKQNNSMLLTPPTNLEDGKGAQRPRMKPANLIPPNRRTQRNSTILL